MEFTLFNSTKSLVIFYICVLLFSHAMEELEDQPENVFESIVKEVEEIPKEFTLFDLKDVANNEKASGFYQLVPSYQKIISSPNDVKYAIQWNEKDQKWNLMKFENLDSFYVLNRKNYKQSSLFPEPTQDHKVDFFYKVLEPYKHTILKLREQNIKLEDKIEPTENELIFTIEKNVKLETKLKSINDELKFTKNELNSMNEKCSTLKKKLSNAKNDFDQLTEDAKNDFDQLTEDALNMVGKCQKARQNIKNESKTNQNSYDGSTIWLNKFKEKFQKLKEKDINQRKSNDRLVRIEENKIHSKINDSTEEKYDSITIEKINDTTKTKNENFTKSKPIKDGKKNVQLKTEDEKNVQKNSSDYPEWKNKEKEFLNITFQSKTSFAPQKFPKEDFQTYSAEKDLDTPSFSPIQHQRFIHSIVDPNQQSQSTNKLKEETNALQNQFSILLKEEHDIRTALEYQKLISKNGDLLPGGDDFHALWKALKTNKMKRDIMKSKLKKLNFMKNSHFENFDKEFKEIQNQHFKLNPNKYKLDFPTISNE